MTAAAYLQANYEFLKDNLDPDVAQAVYEADVITDSDLLEVKKRQRDSPTEATRYLLGRIKVKGELNVEDFLGVLRKHRISKQVMKTADEAWKKPGRGHAGGEVPEKVVEIPEKAPELERKRPRKRSQAGRGADADPTSPGQLSREERRRQRKEKRRKASESGPGEHQETGKAVTQFSSN